LQQKANFGRGRFAPNFIEQTMRWIGVSRQCRGRLGMLLAKTLRVMARATYCARQL
jgi:hypothetical protein